MINGKIILRYFQGKNLKKGNLKKKDFTKVLMSFEPAVK